MKEVKYRVVQKQLDDLKKGDVLFPPLSIEKIYLNDPFCPVEVQDVMSLPAINADGTYNVMEPIQDAD